MQVVIIDDEENAVIYLKSKLTEYDDLEIVGTFNDPCEGLAYLLKHPCDLVFLDIDMPNISGIYIAEQISSLYPKTKICFVTAFNEFAVKAFELNALDYILKPYTEERLNQCLQRLKENEGYKEELIELSDSYKYSLDIICGFDGEDMILIRASDIYYLETVNKDVKIHTLNGVYTGNKTLSFYEDKLMKYSFFRVHKCYLANLDKVTYIKARINYTYDLYFDGIEEKIPVSRNRVRELKQYINH